MNKYKLIRRQTTIYKKKKKRKQKDLNRQFYKEIQIAIKHTIIPQHH